MFNKQKYLVAKLNNYYIDLFESNNIEQEILDELIEELEFMDAKSLYDLCIKYDIPIKKDQFRDIFGNFMG